MQKTISVAYGVDKSYIPHMATSIYSLLLNNKELEFKIYILYSDLPNDDILKIKKIGENFRVNFIFLEISDSRLNSLKVNHHFSTAMYFRLLLPELVPEKKILYLDCDTIIVASIYELWIQELSNNFVGAVQDSYFDRGYLGMTKTSPYFNSGVLLMNNQKIHEEEIKNKAIDLLSSQPDCFNLPDQDVLNLLFAGGWISLSAQYNALTAFFLSNDQLIDEKIKKAILNPIVVHFTGPIKPWHSDLIHPYKKKYLEFRKMTPYRLRWNEYYKLKYITHFNYLTTNLAKFKHFISLYFVRLIALILPQRIKKLFSRPLKDKVIHKILRTSK